MSTERSAIPGRNIVWQHGAVSRDARPSRGATLWFTGFSGSGKSTIASAVEAALVAAGRPAYLLDGDNVRHGLNVDLGFSADDRAENVRRIAHVAQLMADAGVVALVPVISPYRAGRQFARDIHAAAGLPFIEVWVSTPIEECERARPEGPVREGPCRRADRLHRHRRCLRSARSRPSWCCRRTS